MRQKYRRQHALDFVSQNSGRKTYGEIAHYEVP